jgi:predicted alpha/beta superfamily hydrolase
MPRILNPRRLSRRWRSSVFGSILMLAVRTVQADERLLKLEITSHFLKAPRTVKVYLPPSYRQSNLRYPVLYLHDGQNVFSSAGTNICFGWGNWGLDKTADDLSRSGKIKEIILVAIDNSPARYLEYCGRHHSAETNIAEFENYSAFLIQELKPKIDSTYRTRPEAENTGTMGSSLGGICSVVLAWDHPEIFGLAASLSGAFQVEHTNFLNSILRPFSGQAKPTRLYLDSGVMDFTGGDDGKTLTAEVVEEFRRIGWADRLMHFVDAKPLTPVELENVGLRRDKWAEAQTSQHNEFYWRLRAWRALTFLFPPQTGH